MAPGETRIPARGPRRASRRALVLHGLRAHQFAWRAGRSREHQRLARARRQHPRRRGLPACARGAAHGAGGARAARRGGLLR